MHVIVIGAGIVGTSTALALAERGARVTLIEADDRPAEGTSHANGSGITPGHAEPWNPPGTARRLVPALVRRNQPWRIRAGALPGLIGWGLSFLRQSSPERYYRNARHCIRLGYYSRRCLTDWRGRYAFDYDQQLEGSLELYFSEASLSEAHELRRRIDHPEIEFRDIGRDELVRLEPALAPVADSVYGALLFPDHESGDARRFSAIAADHAGALGAKLAFGTRVREIRCRSGRFVSVDTNRGTFGADACIVAAGCATPALLKPLGLRAPIAPVKGYSATIAVQQGDPAPTMPLLDLERRFVTARLGPDRLRIAGLAEFAGPDRRVDRDRLSFLLESASTLLPRMADRIQTAEPNAWTGLRPMTPDGPPLIGPTPIEGLHLNAGHGAMGWTQGCGSAVLAADLLLGRATAIEPDGLLAGRWLEHGSILTE